MSHSCEVISLFGQTIFDIFDDMTNSPPRENYFQFSVREPVEKVVKFQRSDKIL